MASTRSQTRRRRKPKATKANKWEKKFLPILQKHHGHYAKKMYHRLMNKSSSLRSGLRRRSKDYEVEFAITLTEIRNMLYNSYGKPCVYCKKILDVTNMVCDHVVPISGGGESKPKNLQFICKVCNTRKGPLSNRDFCLFLRWIRRQPQDVQAYILRKLSAKEVFR